MTAVDTNQERFEQARAFVESLMNRYASYHQSKESMAYAGVTLFGGLAGTASLSSNWPPDWGKHSLFLAVAASILLWAIFLAFIRFQLTRRRWASLRVAGCERLLADWLQNAPTDKDLALAPSSPGERPDLESKLANLLWGSKEAVQAIDTRQTVYPNALVEKWKQQEKIGTDALKHERLILLSGWLLFFVLLGSAILK